MAGKLTPVSGAAEPDMADREKRDALAIVFQALHIAILIYILTGWALPGVVIYVIAVPLMGLHWPLNRNTCVINNLESLIRTGRWRDPANLEEGAWLRMLVKTRIGWDLSPRLVDRLSYIALAALWGLGLWHFFGRPAP
jgi:hypothetical protein